MDKICNLNLLWNWTCIVGELSEAIIHFSKFSTCCCQSFRQGKLAHLPPRTTPFLTVLTLSKAFHTIIILFLSHQFAIYNSMSFSILRAFFCYLFLAFLVYTYQKSSLQIHHLSLSLIHSLSLSLSRTHTHTHTQAVIFPISLFNIYIHYI